jgi:hypothetical protein
VQDGDTLSSIALEFYDDDEEVAEGLAQVNGIPNPDKIDVDQELILEV